MTIEQVTSIFGTPKPTTPQQDGSTNYAWSVPDLAVQVTKSGAVYWVTANDPKYEPTVELIHAELGL